jgi:hypothetical protein
MTWAFALVSNHSEQGKVGQVFALFSVVAQAFGSGFGLFRASGSLDWIFWKSIAMSQLGYCYPGKSHHVNGVKLHQNIGKL